jgi:electron transfer flavoprotein-quinone oxidoreductase
VQEHIHDCVVVGAGPAGSAAALQMARDGLDMMLLERGKRPGDKNVMSGVLFTGKLAELIPDFQDRAPLERCITGGYGSYFLREQEVLCAGRLIDYRRKESPDPLYTVFRSQFDAWFAEEAEKAGAELFTETVVEDLLWEAGRVAGVHTRRGDLRARVVVGADGVNSTVAEKAGVRDTLAPAEVSLITRQILDLPSEVIEERFQLRPREGALSLFTGVETGPTGKRGIYHTEIYTNRDSLSMTTEARLDVMEACGLPGYEAMTRREQHPYIAGLIQGATLREYQAHLIPYGGIADLGDLYGDGFLLAGDAGKFGTAHGIGSWPAMASGVAAAGVVQQACEKADYSKPTLSVYKDLLDAEGLLYVQRTARQAWEEGLRDREAMLDFPDHLFYLAKRYLEDDGRREEHPRSLWSEAYYRLIEPIAPWYVRWPLNLMAWADTLAWRRSQAEG